MSVIWANGTDLQELFKNYENEYKHHTEQIHCDIIRLYNDVHQRCDDNLKSVEIQVNEAEQCIKMMELEAQNQPLSMRKEYLETIRGYKREIQQVQKDMRKVEYQKEDALQKDDLFGDRISTTQMNQALLQQEDRLVEQNLRLLQAKQTSYQIESQAINIQQNLKDQSDTLSKSLSRTQIVRDDLGESKALADRMLNRIQQRRILMYSVMFFGFSCGTYIVYSWFS